MKHGDLYELGKAGLTLKWMPAGGHCQIIGGAYVVNWWPCSKNRRAYVQGHRESHEGVTVLQVIAMATTASPVGGVRRRENMTPLRGTRKRWKANRFEESCPCWLCGQPFASVDEVTIDHVIPLGRGGLDNPNNWKPAHATCNQKRGTDMRVINDKP